MQNSLRVLTILIKRVFLFIVSVLPMDQNPKKQKVLHFFDEPWVLSLSKLRHNWRRELVFVFQFLLQTNVSLGSGSVQPEPN